MRDAKHNRWFVLTVHKYFLAQQHRGLLSAESVEMFSSMLKDHQRAQEELKVEINQKRALAEKAIEGLTSENVKKLNDGIARAYLNQHKLDSEARKLQANVAKLTKQAQQWMIVCNSLNNAVKDLGDVTTWTKTIENDVKFVTDAIEEARMPPRGDE